MDARPLPPDFCANKNLHMNTSKKSRIAYTAARTLLAIIFIPSAFVSFFVPPAEMGMSDAAATVVENFWATGYLMHAVKAIELLAGLAFLSNRFVKLALVLIAPILFNILLLAVFTSTSGLPVSMVLTGLWGYMVWYHYEGFKPLLKAQTVAQQA